MRNRLHQRVEGRVAESQSPLEPCVASFLVSVIKTPSGLMGCRLVHKTPEMSLQYASHCAQWPVAQHARYHAFNSYWPFAVADSVTSDEKPHRSIESLDF